MADLPATLDDGEQQGGGQTDDQDPNRTSMGPGSSQPEPRVISPSPSVVKEIVKETSEQWAVECTSSEYSGQSESILKRRFMDSI